MIMLLDTCIIIDVLRKQQKATTYLGALPAQPSASVITLMELAAGTNSQKEELLIRKIMSSMIVLPVSEVIAERAGEWLKHYRQSHGTDSADALIAATAEHHQLPLATLNLKHFPMFPTLSAAY
jgi:predicted nucleic acid-binding protein